MTDPNSHNESGNWVRLTELLKSVLPARSLEHLLIELARAIRDVTGAAAAIVSMVPESEQFHAGVVGRRAQSLESKYGAGDWTEARSVQLVRRDAEVNLTSARHVVPMNMGSQFTGGVILEPEADSPLTLGSLDTFIDLSARLISDLLLRSGKVKSPLDDDSVVAPFKSGGIVRVDQAETSAIDFYDELQKARLDAMAEFAAGAGHEINNPVATIAGRAQLLLRNETDPERRQALLAIGGQALRIRDMIGDAMLFARPPQPAPESVNLGEVIHEVVESMVNKETMTCGVEFEAEPDIVVQADPTQLKIVISALIQNSINASTAGSTVSIYAVADEVEGKRGGCIEVHDTGAGLSDRDRECLFDPFYSGRQAGRGLGFGLPKCWRIVSLHGGTISCESGATGTVFRVFWPSVVTSRRAEISQSTSARNDRV